MEQDLKHSVFSSLLWKFFERAGYQVIQLAIQVVLAWILTKEDFGALTIITVFVNVGNVIVQSGLNTALVQDPDVVEEDYSTVMWLSLAISLVLYAGIFALAPAVASFYEMPQLEWPLRVLCLILIVSALTGVQVARVQRNLQFKIIFKSTMVSVIASGALGIGSAMLGAGLWALVIQQLSYYVVNCLMLFIQTRWVPQLVFSFSRARTLFGFGWKLLVSGLLETGYSSLSDLIIGKQFSAETLGVYAQGKRYPQALGYMLDGAIQPVMLSAVSHVQDNLEQVKALVRRALKTSTFLIFPAMTLFAVVAEPVVRLILGEKWLDCVPFLQMYCFIYALLPIHTTNLQALNGMGRSDLFLKLELIKKAYGTVFLLIAAFVFKDVYAMAVCYMITGVIGTFVNSYPNKTVIGYSYSEQVRDIVPAFVVSLLAGACALPVALLNLPDILTILLQALVMATVYLGVSHLAHLEEFEYVKNLALEMMGRKKS